MKFRSILGCLAVSLLIATAGCSLVRMIPGVPCSGIQTEQIPGAPATVLQSDCDGNVWFKTAVDDSSWACYTVEEDSLGNDVVEIIDCP